MASKVNLKQEAQKKEYLKIKKAINGLSKSYQEHDRYWCLCRLTWAVKFHRITKNMQLELTTDLMRYYQ